MRSTAMLVFVSALYLAPGNIGAQVAQQAAPDIGQLTTDCDAKKLDACTELARVYRDGKVVTRDSKRAEALYKRACDGDNGAGCLGLTWYTLPAQRGALMKKACDLDNLAACGSLAYLYDNGADGLTRDWDVATALYRRLCERGEKHACSKYVGPDPRTNCTLVRAQFALIRRALSSYEMNGNHATNAAENSLKSFKNADGCDHYHQAWGHVYALRRDWPKMAEAYQKAVSVGDRDTYTFRESLATAMDHAAAPDGFRNELKTKDAPVPGESAPHFEAIVKAALERWKNDSAVTALSARIPKP